MPSTFDPAQTKIYGTLAGQTQSGSGAYGSVPTVADPTASQASAIYGNYTNLASLYGLANNYNTFAAGQAKLPYQLNLPNYSAMTAQSSQNILNNLNGVVGGDVVNQIAQTAAERGIGTGLGASANTNTALLRSLGLTSLGLQQTGESQLTQAIARTPTGQQLNTASWLTTPEQQQQAQTYANLYASQANPTTAGAVNYGAAVNGTRAGNAGVGSFSGGGGSNWGGWDSRSDISFPHTSSGDQGMYVAYSDNNGTGSPSQSNDWTWWGGDNGGYYWDDPDYIAAGDYGSDSYWE